MLFRPWRLGDGICNAEECNSADFKYDEGDCLLLCFAEELTDCTLDKLMNDRCDPECSNKYCVIYDELDHYAQSDDELLKLMRTETRNGTVFAADNMMCPWNGSLISSESTEYPPCNGSVTGSIYVDPNVPEDAYSLCQESWIGDEFCDG